ncbi:Mis6-domain-containing protein [Mollisia scopiformis]|uniref:Mis6-domain-containing protein n=1 Tax=Mollisia scopiformis TaxID=149040 RepID=A0A194WUX6_MOLSC|nr:Mis6-domain-containing protein [Mollisia scopiformis]KUJ11771.1 Mis6-domain-containing protein [Mollisia scopiformis]
MEDLLLDLESASKRPAKQRAIKISGLIDRVCSKAYDDGFLVEELHRVVDTITLANELDQGSLSNLIRNLYPVSKVPDSVVIKVVSSLGNGRFKPSYNTQAGLLKWLVMVYDVLENPRMLSQLYSIIFNLLDTAAIRPQLCHVLSLITRRKHVRPFRIQLLMELVRRAGNEPPLIGLMRVFKDYYPDVIVGDATAGRASVFTHPNPEWRARLSEVQDLHLQRTQDALPIEQRTFRIANKGTNALKRKRGSVIPYVYTSHAQEFSTTLEEIEDVHEFVQKFEKIDPPNQLVAVISDPLLQKFLHLRSSEVDSSRIDSWLLAFFEDQLQNSGTEKDGILEMLDAILKYARYTKNLPPACLSYLQSMISFWNGNTGADTILGLLTYVPLADFEDLYASTFRLLEGAILCDGTTESKLRLLRFYGSLLDQWITTLLSQPKPIAAAGQAIKLLMEHVSDLSLTIIQSSIDTGALCTVLEFYERAAASTMHSNLKSVVRISLPPAELIYTLHFTNSLAIQSKLCALLAIYKKAFEFAMAPKNAMKQESYSSVYVNGFNGFLMDLCNCLWRSKAFNYADPNARGCLLDPTVNVVLSKYISTLDGSLSLLTLFTFSYSPLLCLLAISHIRELEDASVDEIERRHAGPVSQMSLKQLENQGGMKLSWQDYRLGFLHYLERRGVLGISELMYNTMKHLMPSKEVRS